MSWDVFYAAFGAPLLMLLAGLTAVWMHQSRERRERRLYDDRGWPRKQGAGPRP